jgi:hypothetical protein
MPKQAQAEAQEDVYLDVEIGNSHALEAYRVPNDETLYFRLQEPQGVERVTHARVLRSDPVERQVVDVQGILSHSLQSGEKPDWVECSSSELTLAIISAFGMEKSADRRPATWGRTQS